MWAECSRNTSAHREVEFEKMTEVSTNFAVGLTKRGGKEKGDLLVCCHPTPLPNLNSLTDFFAYNLVTQTS